MTERKYLILQYGGFALLGMLLMDMSFWHMAITVLLVSVLTYSSYAFGASKS